MQVAARIDIISLSPIARVFASNHEGSIELRLWEFFSSCIPKITELNDVYSVQFEVMKWKRIKSVGGSFSVIFQFLYSF